jgi:hypothetical protein
MLRYALWFHCSTIAVAIPVCAGQNETTLSGMRDLIADGAIDVSNFDASWADRPSGERRRGLPQPSAWSSATTRSRRSRAICWRAFPTTRSSTVSTRNEASSSGVSDLSTGIGEGRSLLPERPGFGVELDATYVAARTVDRG